MSTPLSLNTVTVDWDCDRCGSHLMTTSLANMLNHPNLLTAHDPVQCEVCRDLEGAKSLTSHASHAADNDRDLAAWTNTLSHIPDMDGMEWDQWGPVEHDDGPRWSDIIAPLFWVVCGVIVMYAVYGWIR